MTKIKLKRLKIKKPKVKRAKIKVKKSRKPTHPSKFPRRKRAIV